MRRSERLRRNKKIIKLRQERPELTLEDIGDKFGLSAAGVARVIERSNNHKK